MPVMLINGNMGGFLSPTEKAGIESSERKEESSMIKCPKCKFNYDNLVHDECPICIVLAEQPSKVEPKSKKSKKKD